MKIFTTNLSKYLSAIVITTTMLTYAATVSADEYKPMIRQDRVWLCTSHELGENTAKYINFKDSKVIMDKTYTRVSTIKKVTWDFGMTNIRIEENIDETEAWMREENGKVYLLLDGWEPDPDMNSDSSTGPYEGLLYDFNAEVGSSYEGISQYRRFINDPGRYCEGSYHVSSVGMETVGDEEVKCWNVGFRPAQDDTYMGSYPIVEGIGIVDYGGLFYLETFDHTLGNNSYNDFGCYMDLDDNILYPKDYNKELPGGGLSSSVGVVGIEADKLAEADAPRYDILGRRIAEPVPGQLYIQSGKKHIAK